MPKVKVLITLDGADADEAADEIGQALEDLRDSHEMEFGYLVEVTRER